MYRILIISIFSVFLFFNSIYSQTSDKKKELIDKQAELVQQGKLDDAIAVSQKIVNLEKEENSADTSSYANALLNLARMKRDVYLILRDQLKNRKVEGREIEATQIKARESAKAADTFYHQALQLNEQGGRSETTQTADIKSELGWLLYNYIGSRQSIDDSEKFFLESIALNDKLRGKDDDQTLFVVLKTGDFYDEMDNYEKALPFYERYIQTNENTHGKDYQNLLLALRPYAKILLTTFQDREAAEVTQRIEGLSNKAEGLPKTDLDFHLRSKESVAQNMKLIPEYRKGMDLFRARLKAEDRTLNSNNISQVSKLKIVRVNVVVDENGKITEATADAALKDKNLGTRAEQEISKWTVRPFSYNGTTRKMRGILYYIELE